MCFFCLQTKYHGQVAAVAYLASSRGKQFPGINVLQLTEHFSMDVKVRAHLLAAALQGSIATAACRRPSRVEFLLPVRTPILAFGVSSRAQSFFAHVVENHSCLYAGVELKEITTVRMTACACPPPLVSASQFPSTPHSMSVHALTFG